MDSIFKNVSNFIVQKKCGADRNGRRAVFCHFHCIVEDCIEVDTCRVNMTDLVLRILKTKTIDWYGQVTIAVSYIHAIVNPYIAIVVAKKKKKKKKKKKSRNCIATMSTKLMQ